MSIVKAVKVDAVAPAAGTPADSGRSDLKQAKVICENLWQKPALSNFSSAGGTEIDSSSGEMAQAAAKDMFSHSRLTEGETSVTEFIIMVEVGTTVWQVAHRYKDFDLLRQFIALQEPFNTQVAQSSFSHPITLFTSPIFKSFAAERALRKQVPRKVTRPIVPPCSIVAAS